MTAISFEHQPDGTYCYDYTSDGNTRLFQISFGEGKQFPVVAQARISSDLPWARLDEANLIGSMDVIFDVTMPAGTLIRLSTRNCPTAAHYQDSQS